MENSPLRIIQISDIHLFSDKNKELLGVKTQDSFQALFDLLKADNTHADLIVLSGDLSQDGSRESYVRVADMVSELNIPVYFFPGNHDDVEMMNAVYPRGMVSEKKQLLFDHWQLILLDSHIPNAVPGFLAQSEFDFMEQCLNQHPKHKAIIFFHHHPIPVGCEWLDNIGLTNADELWERLKCFPQVSHVIFGHVHQEHEGEVNNIKYYSVPSTCIQFKTYSNNFALEELPPAYRVIDLYPNGELKTYVRRVDHYVGLFDINAKGY